MKNFIYYEKEEIVHGWPVGQGYVSWTDHGVECISGLEESDENGEWVYVTRLKDGNWDGGWERRADHIDLFNTVNIYLSAKSKKQAIAEAQILRDNNDLFTSTERLVLYTASSCVDGGDKIGYELYDVFTPTNVPGVYALRFCRLENLYDELDESIALFVALSASDYKEWRERSNWFETEKHVKPCSSL